MCNSDITIAILEKAIEEEANSKKTGFLGGVFGSKKKPPRPAEGNPSPARPPVRPQIIEQELPPRQNDGSELRNIDSQENSQEHSQRGGNQS